MTTIQADPGICGFKAVITVESDDSQLCTVKIETECDAIASLAASLGEVDAYEAAFKSFSQNPVYKVAEQHYRHAACPIPSAIIKAIEVECSLALPKNVEFIVRVNR